MLLVKHLLRNNSINICHAIFNRQYEILAQLELNLNLSFLTSYQKVEKTLIPSESLKIIRRLFQ